MMIRISTILFASIALASVAGAQTSRPKPDSPPTGSWPKPTSKQASRAKHLIRRVVKTALEDEDTSEFEAELVAMGAGIGKAVLRRLNGSDIRDDGHPELQRVLDDVITDELTPLLGLYLGNKRIAVRRYVSARIARGADKSQSASLKAALADEDELVVFHAALGLAGMSDFAHFDLVFERCHSKDWRRIAPLVAEVLGPVRSSKAKRLLDAKMRKADTLTLVTSLRLMRSLCPKELAGAVAFWLDSQESLVKKEAINALRAIVDGAAPLENLSVFQAIEQVKQWKKRL